MVWLLTTGAVLVLWGTAVALVARDFRRDRELSWPAVTTVWAAYLLHAVLVAAAAWRAPLGRWAGAGGWLSAAGALLTALGVVVAGLAVSRFASFQRMSGRRTDRLVRSGLYAVSRNPQNLGWGLVLLGVSTLGRSTLALLLTLAFAGLLHVYLVTLEEPYLERLYGAEYREYRRRVRRYLGRRGPRPVVG